VPITGAVGWTVSLEAVTTNATLRGLTLYCVNGMDDYNIQLWYSTANFTAANGMQVRNSANSWVQATTIDSIMGTCSSAYAPVPITGLNIPLTLGIKTGLSAVNTLGLAGTGLGYYTTNNATDVRPITSTDGRTVLYFASGGGDAGGNPDTIGAFPRTPLRQIVIEFPST